MDNDGRSFEYNSHKASSVSHVDLCRFYKCSNIAVIGGYFTLGIYSEMESSSVWLRFLTSRLACLKVIPTEPVDRIYPRVFYAG